MRKEIKVVRLPRKGLLRRPVPILIFIVVLIAAEQFGVNIPVLVRQIISDDILGAD